MPWTWYSISGILQSLPGRQRKPSGKAVYNAASVSGDDVSVDVTDQMFAETGLSKVQIEVTHGEDTLVTFVQPVQVRKNYVDGSAPESANI